MKTIIKTHHREWKKRHLTIDKRETTAASVVLAFPSVPHKVEREKKKREKRARASLSLRQI